MQRTVRGAEGHRLPCTAIVRVAPPRPLARAVNSAFRRANECVTCARTMVIAACLRSWQCSVFSDPRRPAVGVVVQRVFPQGHVVLALSPQALILHPGTVHLRVLFGGLHAGRTAQPRPSSAQAVAQAESCRRAPAPFRWLPGEAEEASASASASPTWSGASISPLLS